MYYVLFFYNSKPKNSLSVKESISTTTPVLNRDETYSSNHLGIQLTIPAEFTIKNTGISLVLSKDKNTIVIGRSGSFFDNLDMHIDSLIKKNHLTLSQIDYDPIQSYESIAGYINAEKIYFIYVDSLVFSFSTSSPELYDDLDQIVQSFKYIPD